MAAKLLVQPPLKWHGGKTDLAKWIVSLMPPRCKNPNAPAPDDVGWLHYVEPYFGGGAVLFANEPEGISEVVNDLNGSLVNFWKVLANADRFKYFQRIIEARPFCEKDYNYAAHWSANGCSGFNMPKIASDDETISRAVHFFVACRQSLSGRMTSFASITRNRTRRGMNEQVSAWLNCIEGLPAVHARLKRVLILNRNALDVIRQQDGPRTLFYLDPPYLHETRTTTKEYGEHEMTEQDHERLLEVLESIEGKFLLSGYHSKLYDSFAAENVWTCHEKAINNHAAGGKTKRTMTECIWTNYHA